MLNDFSPGTFVKCRQCQDNYTHIKRIFAQEKEYFKYGIIAKKKKKKDLINIFSFQSGDRRKEPKSAFVKNILLYFGRIPYFKRFSLVYPYILSSHVSNLQCTYRQP